MREQLIQSDFQYNMSESNRGFRNVGRSDPQIEIDEKQIIIEQISNEQYSYYLPCFIRFVFKELIKVDIAGMEAMISGTLLFSFYHRNLPDQILQKLLSGKDGCNILLQFNNQESVELKVGKEIVLKRQKEQCLINFTVRQNFVAKLNGNVFLTPFDIINMDLLVITQTVHFKIKGIQYNIKFNCLDNTEVKRIKHSHQFSFGYYSISPIGFATMDTNTRPNPFEQDNRSEQCFYQEEDENEKDNKKGIKPYQYTHFRIPIFKHPGVSILTIFIPIWILGLIGLCVFFQEQGFGARLATIAVLVLAFVAFLPTINNSIPPTSDLKLVDLLILMQLTSTLLLLIESFQVRSVSNFVFQWQTNRLFLSAFALNCFTIISILFLFVIHKLVWEPSYRKKPSNSFQDLKRRDWSNYECRKYFEKQVNSTLMIIENRK